MVEPYDTLYFIRVGNRARAQKLQKVSQGNLSEQGLSEIQNELDYQGSGSVDLTAAVELGRQLGAEYVFYGRFTTIKSAGGDVESLFYKFTFNAVNTQTRQIVWADEHQMRKRQEKTLFGW